MDQPQFPTAQMASPQHQFRMPIAARRVGRRLAMGLGMALILGLSLPAQSAHAATPSEIYQVLLAELAVQSGQFRVAGEAYLAAANSSRDPAAAERATLLLVASQQPRRALEAADLWQTLSPDNPEAVAAVDGLRLTLGMRYDLAKSLTERREAARRTKTLPAFYEGLDQLLRQSDRPDRGLALFDEVSAPDRSLFEVRYLRALILERAQRFPEMESALRSLIHDYPNNAQALNALGYSLVDRNRSLPEAEALITKANKLMPGAAHIEDSMGWLFYRQGKTAQAKTWLLKAYGRSQDPEISAHLGEVLWTLNQRQEAVQVLAKAFQADPNNPVLVETLQRLGLTTEALPDGSPAEQP